MLKNIKKKKIKHRDVSAMELHLNGLYRMKIIPNKKKEQKNRKKFNLKNEMNSYLITFGNCGKLLNDSFHGVIK